jgi:hypothetical protein
MLDALKLLVGRPEFHFLRPVKTLLKSRGVLTERRKWDSRKLCRAS